MKLGLETLNEKRESVRLKDSGSRRVLDEAARKRRQRKALEALEQDNFHDDPHANLVMHKKAPKFEESLDRAKRRKKGEHLRQRFKKTFAALLEEDQTVERDGEGPTYITATVPASKFPERKFCAVCGFPSNYTCPQCGARYCSVKCVGTHRDTRCLKWTA